MKYLFIVLYLLLSSIAYADSEIPALDDIPSILIDAEKIKFTLARKELENELEVFQAAGNAFNAKAAKDQTDEEYFTLEAQQSRYITAAVAFNQNLINARDKRVLESMLAAVNKAPWSAEEKDRAATALKTLSEDGEDTTSNDIRRIWRDIHARGDNEIMAHQAAASIGPGLSGAGNQTIYEDCTIFALANAAGVPYGIAAARATDFIANGEWRPLDERANPQQAIEENGLMGGEVILVAEAFGQVKIVPSNKFERTLQAGQPIMVALFPSTGSIQDGHEVVLTRTFQYEGATWFELIDSNKKNARQRLYLNQKELGMLLKENGVSFQPEDHRTPMPLRRKDTK